MRHYGEQAGIHCLNKGWKFVEKDFSILPPTKNHDDVYAFSKAGAAGGPASANFDDSEWEEVDLPRDWVVKKEFVQTGSPNQGYKERGIGWYRLRFGLSQEDKEKQILLEFEGMSVDAQIYVNGSIMKHSYSGYNSFCVDITDIVNFGVVPNTIAIRIDATAWEGWWYEGAGIYRNVWMIKKSPVHIKHNGVFAKPEKLEENQWKLHLDTELENSFEFFRQVTIINTLMDGENQIIGECTNELRVEAFESTTYHQELLVKNPMIWDVEEPNLYQVRTVICYDGKEQDYQVQSIGFRTIALLADSGFWLNGKNIKLKGFCNHQDHAGVGVAVPYTVKEWRVKKLKELGANAYRCSHNPDPEILEICDRIGLVVMEENRTYNSSQEVLEGVREIVKNARNHPSVVLYSIFNEEPLQGTEKGRRMAGKLQATVKALDSTRPVLGAFNGGYMEEQGAATILDAVGINYNPKRYDDFHAKYPNIPLIGSETASALMVRGEYETDWNAHTIASYDDDTVPWGTTVKDTWRYVNERPFVAGSFVWTGFDYRGEPTPFEWPSVGTFFGTYDSCGFEKDACYFYRAFWKKEPMVHLISPWCDRKKMEDHKEKMIRVMTVTNCEQVELFVNGVSMGRKIPDPYDQAEYWIPKATGELKLIGYNKEVPVAEDVQLTAQEPERLLMENEVPDITDSGMDAAVINLSLVDKNGTVIPDSFELVTFEIENGRIIGVGNGDPNSHEPDVANYRSLFHGHAQVIVKPNSDQEIKITAKTTSGMESQIVIPVQKTKHIPYIDTLEEKVLDGWGLYYRLFSEKPDPTIETEANDMNSFEPVQFSGQSQAELSGKLNQYGMYQTKVNFARNIGDWSLYVNSVLGHVWIYMDGEEIYSRTDAWGGEIILPLRKEMAGSHRITVVVYNGNPEYAEAGICTPIILCKS